MLSSAAEFKCLAGAFQLAGHLGAASPAAGGRLLFPACPQADPRCDTPPAADHRLSGPGSAAAGRRKPPGAQTGQDMTHVIEIFTDGACKGNPGPGRSEERRVGKECGSGGS